MRSENPIEMENKAPKGVGISPKAFAIFLGALAILFFIVFALIFHYKSDQNQNTSDATAQQNTLVPQNTGLTPDSAIDAINHNAKGGILVKQGTQSKTQGSSSEQSQSASQEGANAQTPTQSSGSASSQPLTEMSVMNNFSGPASSASNVSQAGASNNSAGQSNNTVASDQNDHYGQQNMQNEKVAFLQANQKKDDKFYLNSKLLAPVSPYEVKAGTMISCTLLTAITSDLPGQITAQVSKNVYDTVTGNYLLIPQGTKVIGVYDSQVSYGQDRVLIAWSRLIYPDGSSFDLEGQPGVDLAGMAGLHDLVDNHYIRLFGSALGFSLFGALGQLSQPKQEYNSYPTNSQIIYGAVGQQLMQVGAQQAEKNMNIQPTVNIRNGDEFNILLTRDMVLPGPYQSQNNQVIS